MVRKAIRQYYVLTFLSATGGIQIVSAVYVTFLMKHGLNLFEVNLVNAIYFFTLFICELPTGAFADVFGRKASHVVSCLIVSLGMVVYGLSDTFFGFVCAEIIAAIGSTFRTGAFQSWLVDTLKHHGHTGPYNKIFGRAQLQNQLGGGLGAILGAYLASTNIATPWFVGGGIMFLLGILSHLILNEEYFKRQKFCWRKGVAEMKSTTLKSIRYGSEDKSVRFILMVTFLQIYVVKSFDMYWQPFFRERGVAEEHLGILFAGMISFLALGSYAITRIEIKRRERKIILLSMILVGTMVMLGTMSPLLPLSLGFFLLHEFGRGFWGPVTESYLHERIPSHERATIVSFCGMAPHIGGAIGLLLSGVLAESFGINTTWIISSLALLLAAILVRKNGH